MDRRGSLQTVLLRVLVICACAAASGVITAKAFYCRDPDTGKLYPVNTTWHSSSFCGKYTCKLRQKTQDSEKSSEGQYYNEGVLDSAQSLPTSEGEIRKNCTQPVGVIVEDKTKSDVQDLQYKKKDDTYVNLDKFKTGHDTKKVQLAAATSDGDRYLTEEEITALSLLLQTMKKSDLEAILEVYNLAQDIYKEIDKVPGELNINNDKKNCKENQTGENVKANEEKQKKVSYWYEPLTAINTKLKEAEMVVSPQINFVPGKQAVSEKRKPKATALPKTLHEGLNLIQETKTKQKVEMLPKHKTSKAFEKFFEGPLATGDFRKLQYYHPLSNFQKQSSYARPAETYQQSNSGQASYSQSIAYSPSDMYAQPGIYPPAFFQLRQYPQLVQYPQQPNEVPAYVQQQNDNSAHSNSQRQKSVQSHQRPRPHKCCKNHSDQNLKLIPWSKIMKSQDDAKIPSYNSDKTYDSKPTLSYSESKIKAQTINFPFEYSQNMNISSVPNPYYPDNSWNGLNLSKKQNGHQPTYLETAYIAQIPNEVTANAGASLENIRDEQEVLQNTKDSKPDWQTEPLSISVLNEVKANTAKLKFLPYPFRRKVKLDKVGRLLRLEEGGRIKRELRKLLSRKPRQINLEEYEVYIEKSTCDADTEPGFFRMGNSSEPFPACCPQRISS